jgi:ketosteroid isomerase-like protein
VSGERYGLLGAQAQDVQTVRAIYDAFARRDIDAALAHVAEDVEFFPEGTASLVGRGGPYTGHDGVRRYFADAARVWDELVLQAEDIRAVAGSVVVFGQVRGRVGEEPVRRRVIWTWKVTDGRATSMRVRSLGDAGPV